MGVAAAVIGGGLLGLGAAAKMSKKASYVPPSQAASTMAPGRPVAPAVPEASPEAADPSATQNERMEAERERERQAALFRQRQAQEVFTSGLGASGTATTGRKALLGG